MKKILVAVATAAVLLTPLGSTPSAQAESVQAPVAQKAVPGKTTRDAICIKARKRNKEPGKCEMASGGKVISRKKQTSVRTLPPNVSNRPADGTGPTLRKATLAGTVTCVKWNEYMRGLYYINWKEIHKGTACYNGKDVYVAKNQTGHQCQAAGTSGIGYSISREKCYLARLSNPQAQGGYGIQNWDRYRVSAAVKGSPLFKIYEMHVNVYPSGTVTYY